jgi:hypothetical protein
MLALFSKTKKNEEYSNNKRNHSVSKVIWNRHNKRQADGDGLKTKAANLYS